MTLKESFESIIQDYFELHIQQLVILIITYIDDGDDDYGIYNDDDKGWCMYDKNVIYHEGKHYYHVLIKSRPYFTEELVEADDTVRVIVLGDVSLAGQGSVTEPAAEMLDMPGPAFCLGVLSWENDLDIGRGWTVGVVSQWSGHWDVLTKYVEMIVIRAGVQIGLKIGKCLLKDLLSFWIRKTWKSSSSRSI